ncbi:5-formyltetrahydrofolate cyclo-ligase [Teleopsis dalmanni]|uniref:5-formyltetrahydrofolate cyclo-ligase-like n=1 Tax=Teleopsis dalmanni TaxID=139649 RepID=UPI0018CE1D46|nr:5-formyltetrahydrofolate cyclo-ligase-like [Teleopsis dalmanni]XP_037953035.1 5-formyltetrahydrofolate cyclo-ligase [Teleopsis dalmanni]
MTANIGNSLKIALRNRMKNEVLKSMTVESRAQQSEAIKEKVLQSTDFRHAQRISVYLSTSTEVDTLELLKEMFRLDKHVYVPTYSGNNMEMVRIKNMDDYDNLPLTKWNIKQPDFKEPRENALTNGHGIDLFLMPGVAFSLAGGRLGHGMGYYDKYLKRHFNTYPQKKVTLIALAFREQIVAEDELPLDAHDVKIHRIITA